MDKATSTSGPMAVDLRALVMAGVAVSPLYLWFLVDSVNWFVDGQLSSGQIVLETAFFAVDLLFSAVGTVVVALGGALLWRRGRVRPFSFTLTSLAVVSPLVAVDAIMFVPSMRQQEAYIPTDIGSLYYIVTEILRYTVTFGAVALAARLYASWSSTGSDTLEARRCIALGVVVAVIATVSTLNWISFVLTIVSQLPNAVPVPVAILQGVQHLMWSLVSAAGPTFLFGFVAIHAVRRQQRERRVGALIFAGSCAAIVYVLLVYGRGLGPVLVQDLSLIWQAHTVIDYKPLVGAAFAGVGGAILYAFAIDGAALRARLRALPSTLLSVRNRPFVSDDEIER